MKGKILFALMIVGILVFAGIAVGVAYSKYGDVTTEVVMDDGLTCTINGKEVKNGDTITVNLQSTKLNVCVNTEKATRIACTGWWQSSNDRITFQDGTDEAARECHRRGIDCVRCRGIDLRLGRESKSTLAVRIDGECLGRRCFQRRVSSARPCALACNTHV